MGVIKGMENEWANERERAQWKQVNDQPWHKPLDLPDEYDVLWYDDDSFNFW